MTYQMFQNPYYMPLNPYQVPYAMQQVQTQQPQQPQQNQQQITTQPPIMQPQANIIGSKILPVTNKEEATVAPVDLVQGTPSFFYNKSNGEIYLKQFDVPTGTAIFKVYGEIVQPKEETPAETQKTDYSKEFQYISEGIDNLHRMLVKIQNERPYIEKVEADVIDIEPESMESYTKTKNNKKRGQ